jgi:hypothetical protein
LLLLLAALAHAEGPDRQVVQIVVSGEAPSGSIRALDGEGRVVTLTDPGIGALTGAFEGPPRRVMQLRLLDDTRVPSRRIHDALVTLTDAEHQTLAFAFSPNTNTEARRLPLTAPTHVDHHPDPRVPWVTALGWGMIVAVYTAGLGLAWALRGRRG